MESLCQLIGVAVLLSWLLTFRVLTHHLLQTPVHIFKIDVNRFFLDVLGASLNLHFQLNRPLNLLLEQFAFKIREHRFYGVEVGTRRWEVESASLVLYQLAFNGLVFGSKGVKVNFVHICYHNHSLLFGFFRATYKTIQALLQQHNKFLLVIKPSFDVMIDDSFRSGSDKQRYIVCWILVENIFLG